MTMRAVGGNGGGKAVVACVDAVEDFAYGPPPLGLRLLGLAPAWAVFPFGRCVPGRSRTFATSASGL